MLFAWEEHPFEWVEGRRMGACEYSTARSAGWSASSNWSRASAAAPPCITACVWSRATSSAAPSPPSKVGLGRAGSLGQLYRRIDRFLVGQAPSGPRAFADPFEERTGSPKARRQRLEGLLGQLIGLGVDATTAERLGDFLAAARAGGGPHPPARSADRLGLDPDKLTAACLQAPAWDCWCCCGTSCARFVASLLR